MGCLIFISSFLRVGSHVFRCLSAGTRIGCQCVETGYQWRVLINKEVE